MMKVSRKKEIKMASIYVKKKYNGDDSYSWAIFKREDVKGMGSYIAYGDARPLRSGMESKEATWEMGRLEKKAMGESVEQKGILSEASSLFERIIDDEIEVEDERVYEDDTHPDVAILVDVIEDFKSTLPQGDKQRKILQFIQGDEFVEQTSDIDADTLFTLLGPLEMAIKRFDFDAGSNRINNFPEYLTSELSKVFEF